MIFTRHFGQYRLYRNFIKVKDPERIVYLAVPEQIYIDEFSDPDIIWLCKIEHIKLTVFNPINEEIVEWKETWKKSRNTKK